MSRAKDTIGSLDLVNLGGPGDRQSLGRYLRGRGSNNRRRGGNSTRGHPLVPSPGGGPINTRPLRTVVGLCASPCYKLAT